MSPTLSQHYDIKLQSNNQRVQAFMQHQKVLMMMYLWSILTISFSKKKKEASYSAATHQKELMEQAIWCTTRYWNGRVD